MRRLWYDRHGVENTSYTYGYEPQTGGGKEKGRIMKKKLLALIAVMAIAMSFAGCKKDETKTSQVTGGGAETAQTEQTAAPDKSADEVKKEMDNFAKDADKNVDMGKIDGKALKDASSDKSAAKGTLSNYEVEIKDAKLTDSDNGKVVIVEYEFKNNTATALNFAGVIKTNAMQDESDLQTSLLSRF